MEKKNVTSFCAGLLIGSVASLSIYKMFTWYSEKNMYEDKKLVDDYIQFHYNDNEDILQVGNFPKEIVKNVMRVLDKQPTKNWRVLDAGCGPGRMTFELARNFEFAVGFDYSSSFIDWAKKFQKENTHVIKIQEQGDIYTERKIQFDGKSLTNTFFFVGDAHKIPKSVDGFDLSHFNVIVAANLIDRLTDPRVCLKYLSSIQKSGDWLFFTDPYSWYPEYTPKERWIGAKGTTDTLTELKQVLHEYDLKEKCDIPFVIREHSRKYQYSPAEFSAWVKK